MQAIFDMFEERVQEIDLYFKALKELDQGNTEHLGTSHYFNSEFIKILKGNTRDIRQVKTRGAYIFWR